MTDTGSLRDLVVASLEEMKAVDPVVLDVAGLTSVTDYMIIATGTSGRHVRALADRVVEDLREQDLKPLGVEGKDAAEWVLLDFGDVLVHLMQEEIRQFYDLERLWSAPTTAESEI